MRSKTKIITKHLLLFIVAWIIITYFYYFFAWFSISNLLKQNLLKEYLDSGLAYVEITIFGVIFGLLFGIIDIISDRTFIRKKSLGFIIFMKSLFYIFSFLIVFSIILSVFLGFNLMSQDYLKESFSYLTPIQFLSFFVYITFAILFLNFLIQINKKFGPGILLDYIKGKYHQPREEERIFMFLDLKGSTAITKKLGNNTYSQFISHCFYDLTDLVVKYNAQIYQYVGDEVVLSWKGKEGLKNMTCIRFFKDFENILQRRKNYYQKKFGIIPKFKAAVDMGKVTVAEIGEIKREIAFHGEALNKAARMENMCNQLNRSLLISEYLKNRLNGSQNSAFDFMGEYHLRGIEGNVKIYSPKEN